MTIEQYQEQRTDIIHKYEMDLSNLTQIKDISLVKIYKEYHESNPKYKVGDVIDDCAEVISFRVFAMSMIYTCKLIKDCHRGIEGSLVEIVIATENLDDLLVCALKTIKQ